MEPDRLGGFICCIIIFIISILIGFGLYQFINFKIGKIIFIIYNMLAFCIDIIAAIYFTDDDNLI